MLNQGLKCLLISMETPTTKKESILEAAAYFFSEKGYRNTSMGQVAQESGVADGTVFYHYKTKEDLFLAVLENFKKAVMQECDEYLIEEDFVSGLAMVEGVLSFYIYLTGKMQKRFLLLHRHYPYQLAQENPKCRQHLSEIYSYFVSLFERAIIRGQKDGSIGNVPAEKTALLIFTLVDGVARLETYDVYRIQALYSEMVSFCHNALKVS